MTTASPLDALRFSLEAGENMARKFGVQKGHVFKKGPSWFVSYREYVKNAAGEVEGEPITQRLGPTKGPEALSKKEAQRIASEDFLAEVNRRNLKPSSSMPFADFISSKFQLQVIDKKKAGGRKHYNYVLSLILPLIGNRRLRDLDVDAVETTVMTIRAKGLSWQVAKHCQATLHRAFKLAKRLELYHGDNPAAGVDPGEQPLTKKRPGYTWTQAATVLARLKDPARTMAKLSIATSMNVAEMCGIRLKWCNFTDQIKVVEGEVLAPFSIAVREHWYDNERGTLKAGRRRRNVPLTADIAAELALFTARETFAGPDDPLFVSRTGTPVDQHNISNRHFRPLSVKVGFPVTWHGFRRAHSTFTGTLEGISVEDRRANMGHADAEMSLYYSIADIERRRQIPEQIMAKLAKTEPKLEDMQAVGGVA